MLTTIRQQVAHMAWANRLVLDSLRAANPLDPKLTGLFGHVLAAEHLWVCRLTGSTATIAVWPTLSLDQCEAQIADNHQRLEAFVATLDADGLVRPVTYTNTAGLTFTSTVAEILGHLPMHGAYHRGQIAWELRQQDQTPRPTDFIAFTRGAPTTSQASS